MTQPLCRSLPRLGRGLIGGLLISLPFLAWSASGPASEDGVSPKQLLIGQTITLQDGRNDYGVSVLQGVKVLIDQVNAEGGVHGRQVLIKVLDDQNKPEQAEANARKLVSENKVFLLFGPIEGGPSTAVMKAAVALNVPLFGPMAGSPTLRSPHQPLVFPVRAGHKEEFKAILEHARAMSKVAFFRVDSDTGLQHLENMKRLGTPLGMKVVADLAYRPDISDAQLDAMVQQLQQSGAQLVINHGNAAIYERLIRRIKAAKLPVIVYGVNSGSTQLVQRLGPDLSHGMVFSEVMPNPNAGNTMLTRNYRDAFRKAHPGKNFSYGSLEGYATALALVEALKRAGPNPTRQSFLAGLRNADLAVDDLRVSYREGNHIGLSRVELTVVSRDGAIRH